MKKAIVIGSKNFVKNLKCTTLSFIDKICDVSVLSDFTNYYNKITWKKAEYIVIDLSVCCNWLIWKEKKLHTFLSAEQDPIKVYDPVTYVSSAFDHNFNAFMQLVQKHFDDRHIILVRNGRTPAYFVIKDQLRTTDQLVKYKEIVKNNNYIRSMEDKFLKKIPAVQIRILDHYFWEKKPGIELCGSEYEKTAYQDIACWIDSYTEDGKTGRGTPVYVFKLKRYIQYQPRTVHFDVFKTMFDENQVVDHMVLCSPTQYVQDHLNEFVLLKEMLGNVTWEKIEYLTVFQNVLSDLKYSEELTKDFKDVVVGFILIQSSEIESNIDIYKNLFRNGIVSEEIKSMIRHELRNENYDLKKIHSRNAGFYFAKSMGAEDEVAETFVEDYFQIDPVLVDVYGSCIAYETINYRTTGARELLSNHYWAHMPLFESTFEEIQVPENAFRNGVESEFDKNVRIQFQHKVKEDILNSEAQWCLVDLYSFISPKIYIKDDFWYADYESKFSSRFASRRMKPWYDFDLSYFKSEEGVRRLNSWCRWMREKYGTQIIFVNFAVATYKIGDDGRIYNAYPNGERKDQVVKEMYRMIRERMPDCFYLDFGEDFLADDLGYACGSSVHYEFAFYDEMYRRIKNIIIDDVEPRCISHIPDELRLKRMLQLRKKNAPEVLDLFFHDRIDSFVLRMDTEVIEKYWKDILNLYQKNISDLTEMIYEMQMLYRNDYQYYEQLHDSIFELRNRTEEPGVAKILKKYRLPDKERLYRRYKDKLQVNSRYTVIYADGEERLYEQKMISGVKATLLRSPFKEGLRFIGWVAVRSSDGMVSASVAGGKIKMVDQSLMGKKYKPFLYPEECEVINLSMVDGDEVVLFAQWEELELE